MLPYTLHFNIPYTNVMMLPYTLHFNIPYTNVMVGSHDSKIQKWVYIPDWIYTKMACSHGSKIQKWNILIIHRVYIFDITKITIYNKEWLSQQFTIWGTLKPSMSISPYSFEGVPRLRIRTNAHYPTPQYFTITNYLS